MVKNLEDKSIYTAYDVDGDNTVSDAELQMAKDIKKTEEELRKHLAQLRMARGTLIAMGVFTAAMFFIELNILIVLFDRRRNCCWLHGCY